MLTTLLFLAAIQTTMKTPTLTTKWTSLVNADAPHPEYPRPQLTRKAWVNLNGKWDFALSDSAEKPGRFGSKIVVPFPIESYLSGIQKPVPKGGSAWYRRTFDSPKSDRLLLHFEASDWDTTVWVNGVEVGRHTGGYDPFTFDITPTLKGRKKQELVVRVIDPTDGGNQPRGKQVRRPGGIFYTSTTGIWQTVWLEPVSKTYLRDVKINATNDGTVLLAVDVAGDLGSKITVKAEIEGGVDSATLEMTAGGDGQKGETRLVVKDPELWSPEHPRLYKLKIQVNDDTVESYSAFREVTVGPDEHGITRLLLNGRPYFMVGPLDQGFWPDGLYTAPTDAAMRYDIDVTKKLGFNMIRKHVKVEPRTWYAYCDKVGLLVWQDMPSGDGFIGSKDPDLKRSAESAADFEKELKAMIDHLHNSPSIVTWVLFNEGWGQFDTPRLAKWVKDYDPSRLLDATTGWTDRGVGDMIDIHQYPGPAALAPEAHRASVLGEFGGLGLPIPDHMWQEKAWGYQSFKSQGELTDRFEGLFGSLFKLIGEPGCSAAVYTQTTDVETEANGLMTYDRAVLKMDAERIRTVLQLVTAGN